MTKTQKATLQSNTQGQESKLELVQLLAYDLDADIVYRNETNYTSFRLKKQCNVQQKSLYQFLKISFKFKKCAISNKSIQNGRPSRSPKKDKKEPKKAREPRKNPRNPRGQYQRPQKN